MQLLMLKPFSFYMYGSRRYTTRRYGSKYTRRPASSYMFPRNPHRPIYYSRNPLVMAQPRTIPRQTNIDSTNIDWYLDQLEKMGYIITNSSIQPPISNSYITFSRVFYNSSIQNLLSLPNEQPYNITSTSIAFNIPSSSITLNKNYLLVMYFVDSEYNLISIQNRQINLSSNSNINVSLSSDAFGNFSSPYNLYYNFQEFNSVNRVNGESGLYNESNERVLYIRNDILNTTSNTIIYINFIKPIYKYSLLYFL